MGRCKSAAGAAIAVMLVAAAPAAAWSNQGHMITGAIAHDRLATTSPAVIAMVEAAMQAHPEWPRFKAALAPFGGAARTRRLFELMARWPDDARGGPYDRSASHYWVRLLVSRADPVTLPPAVRATTNGQAVEAYALHLATVRDAFAPPADRAMSLCWLMHLAGDIQQPLHAAQLASGRFPRSDAAGSFAFVRTAAAAPLGLHEYWDNVVGGDNDDDANVAAQSLRLPQLWPASALPELDGKASASAFRRWADESFRHAWQTAYDNGRFEGGTAPATAVTLSDGYQAARQTLGERRIALSGYRIADALQLALATTPPAGAAVTAGSSAPSPHAAPSDRSGPN